MMTTLDWIANKFNRVDLNDLNDLETEIAHRLIDEGYLYEEPVICDKNHGSILYYELIYCPT